MDINEKTALYESLESGMSATAVTGHGRIRIGVAAMASKVDAKPMQSILERVRRQKGVEVVIFGDKCLLERDVEKWPKCSHLIAFYSTGFPLERAVRYAELFQPVMINSLVLQHILFDRRLVLALLTHLDIPTAPRIILNRDGGPRVPQPAEQEVLLRTGLRIGGLEWGLDEELEMMDDEGGIRLGSKGMRKPFVEKPIEGEDHEVNVYFREGGRRLFRKVKNQSSAFDPSLLRPRSLSPSASSERSTRSYIYEQYLPSAFQRDIKVYTLGPNTFHAEARKSPTVDGVVLRDSAGKEVRDVVELTAEEKEIARKVVQGFGQMVCGFDILRSGGKSWVVDVNGWSAVKGDEVYYNQAARFILDYCIQTSKEVSIPIQRSLPSALGRDLEKMSRRGILMEMARRSQEVSMDRLWSALGREEQTAPRDIFVGSDETQALLPMSHIRRYQFRSQPEAPEGNSSATLVTLAICGWFTTFLFLSTSPLRKLWSLIRT